MCVCVVQCSFVNCFDLIINASSDMQSLLKCVILSDSVEEIVHIACYSILGCVIYTTSDQATQSFTVKHKTALV